METAFQRGRMASDFQNDERVLRKERIHGGIFVIPAIILLLCLIPDVFVYYIFSTLGRAFGQNSFPFPIFGMMIAISVLPGIAVLGAVWLAYLKSEVTLTNKRLIFRTGFIARLSGELPLENIEGIFLLEPVLGRLLGYGTVMATSIGGARFPFRFIGTPQMFHAALQRSVVAAKKLKATAPKVPPVDDDARFMPKA